jgi:hypothetical protein
MPILFRIVSILVLTAITGCGQGENPDSGPFGPSKESRLLSPFAGEWRCDFEKTIEARQAAGTSDDEIEHLRKFSSDHPQFSQLHPDLNIIGDVAVSPGIPSSEYRFFAMHQHGDKVCGKAWHHEDRFDPGDMSKCYVRLILKEKDFHLEVRMQEGFPEEEDPDLKSLPPTESGSATDCDVEHPAGADWGEWTTYVFSRK